MDLECVSLKAFINVPCVSPECVQIVEYSVGLRIEYVYEGCGEVLALVIKTLLASTGD